MDRVPGALEPWIASGHLAGRKVPGRPTERCACFPLDGFLVPRVADELADFVSGARLQPMYRLYTEPEPVPRSRWIGAREVDRFVQAASVSGVGDDGTSDGAIRYLRVLHMLRSEAFRKLVGTFRGKSVGSIHELATWSMTAGDFVRPHRYDVDTCDVRVELWLSTRWDDDLGGALCVVDDQERRTQVPFRHNRLILLDPSVGATFWVAPIRPAAAGSKRAAVIACFGRAA